MKKYLTTICFVVSGFLAFSQRNQAEFLEAKRLFRTEQYREAQSAFQDLSSDKSFGKHASFYFALASYNLGDTSTAQSMWKQILAKNRNWDKNFEVLYWLIYSNYQSGNYGEALRFSQELDKKFTNQITSELANFFLENATQEQLEKLYAGYSDRLEVATALAKVLSKKSPEERDGELLKELITKFELNPSLYRNEELPMLKKRSYSVAVMLPFMFESLESTIRIENNNLVMNLYQGMLLAQEDLRNDDIEIELFPLDTRRSEKVTQVLLENPSLKDADLIVGPLYPNPVALAKEFSSENKINLINPVSSNKDIINESPYTFLFKASNETVASKLADYAIENIKDSVAAVYFSKNPRDSMMALIYKEKIEKAGFNVVGYKSLDNLEARALLDTLIETYDELIASKAIADSISQIPERFVRERAFDEDDDPKSLVHVTEGGDSLIYYEVKFKVPKDSIGHFMVATRENGIANTFISAIETRSDSATLLGYGNWLEFEAVDYSQIERLPIFLAINDYLDESKEEFIELEVRVVEQFRMPASKYHFLGYELMDFVGRALKDHGKYFQNGLIQDGIRAGKFMEGHYYGPYNDNQIVPVLQLIEGQLKSVIEEYEERP